MRRKRHSIPINILSVDFDYFLPREIDSFDWGHRESGLFYEALWPMRANNHPCIGTPEERQKCAFDLLQLDASRVLAFWDQVLAPDWDPFSACIADSHADILKFLPTVKFTDSTTFRVINFDAHHDAGYGYCPPVDCGNWAQALKNRGELHEYIVCYPEWRQEHPEGIPKKSSQPWPPAVDRVRYGAWMGEPLKPLAIFLCRSSCWMPPWNDALFIQFAKQLRARCGNVCSAPYAEKERPFHRAPEVDWSKVAACRATAA